MTTFADLGLSPSTVQAVIDTGYTTPTPIQEQAIPVALAGRDVLGIAQTGTGKTAAFTLPMIDRLSAGRAKARMPRSLVIAPTRELADQVAASFDKYAKGTKLSWALLIGGVSFKDQEMKIDRGVDVLIATPGRLLDFYERRKLMLLDVKTLVVDEADRMLDMGFIPDLERIFEITPKVKQTLFFSATMPPEITRLTSQFLKDPTRIEVSRPASTGENITQFVARVPLGDPKAKRLALRALLEKAAPESGIIFCNRKSEVDIVAKSLRTHGFDAAPIHGDLDQSMRTKTLDSFRKGELKLLVASDVAARGLDIPAVSHVFNYDVPHHADDYVHRIGRTGRAGRLGEAFIIVSPNDEKNWDKVVKLTKKEPQEVVLELDWAAAAEAGARDKERHGGGSGRGRGDRDRSAPRGRDRDRDRNRPVADHGQRASMEAIAAPEPSAEPETAAVEPRAAAPPETRRYSANDAPPPREERPRRDDRPRRDERPAREERQARDDRPPRRDERPARDETRADRGPRRDGGRDYGRDRSDRFDRDDRPVVGFGADTPAFLLRSALPAPSSAEDEAELEALDSGLPAPERIAAEADAPPAAKPARTRSRGRGRGKAEAAEPVATDVLPVAAEVIAEALAETAPEPEAAPKPARKPRVRKAAAVETVAELAEPVAEEPPAKPKRTRKKAEPAPAIEAAPADTAPVEPEAAEPAAKRAPRRRKPPVGTSES